MCAFLLGRPTWEIYFPRFPPLFHVDIVSEPPQLRELEGSVRSSVRRYAVQNCFIFDGGTDTGTPGRVQLSQPLERMTEKKRTREKDQYRIPIEALKTRA